ncbi:MAG: hypothetical protein K8953_05630, partial [Proteobacteria bacterium]|nr:hypothetical protein [Pseudomonadota bacterium]
GSSDRGISADTRNGDGTSTGNLTIIVGDVTTPTNLLGISSTVAASGEALTLQGAIGTSGHSITGAVDGVYMRTLGGDIDISNIGVITGTSGAGIDGRSAGGNISISDIGVVTGSSDRGISADTRNGDGTSTGTITIGGAGGDAIGDVSGLAAGIVAYTDFGGINITTANVTGRSFNTGITAQIGRAIVTGSTADIIIDSTAGSVVGDIGGIFVNNFGTGATNIAVGNVTAGITQGINTQTRVGANITVVSGSVIRGGGGTSIRTGESMASVTPPDRITLMGAAMGAVRTYAGDDVVTLMDCGSFGSFDGGTGSDILNVEWDTGVLNTPLIDVEQVNFNRGTTTAMG